MKAKEASPKLGFIVIAKLGATYGLHGWLKVNPYTEFGVDIFNFQPWYISRDESNWQEIALQDHQAQENRLLAKFEGINTPEEARTLTNHLIAIDRAQLPKLAKGEYYWSDLIGLEVLNKTGDSYGTVKYIMETGSNDVLVVKKDKEYAIPFLLHDVILEIDLKNRKIIVDWDLI